jgi:hypothetical protein
MRLLLRCGGLPGAPSFLDSPLLPAPLPFLAALRPKKVGDNEKGEDGHSFDDPVFGNANGIDSTKRTHSSRYLMP